MLRIQLLAIAFLTFTVILLGVGRCMVPSQLFVIRRRVHHHARRYAVAQLRNQPAFLFLKSSVDIAKVRSVSA